MRYLRITVKGDRVFLHRIGLINRIRVRTEHVYSAELKSLHKSTDSVRLRLKLSISEYVAHRRALRTKFPTDEDGAMAVHRITLRTHQRDAMQGGTVEEALNSTLKELGLGQASITHLGTHVAMVVSASSAKLFPKENVLDPSVFEGGAQRIPVKLRVVSAER
nr:hypothetical protein [Acidiferrobacter sp. SPIII_3]